MKHPATLCCLVIISLALTGCAGSGVKGGISGTRPASSGPVEPGTYEVFGKSYRTLPDSHGYLEIGIASWYGRKFHGRLTANGEKYDMYAPSAAHRSLPLPTFVKVTNLNNQRHIIVRINDRGPFHSDRLIDLSYNAAVQLDFVEGGTAPVVVEAVDYLNYPDEVVAPVSESAAAPHEHSYYLQLGAFLKLSGAEQLLQETRSLLSQNDLPDIQIKILSEESEVQTLHKVWMGPLFDEQEREQIVALVEGAELAKPIRVQLD